MKNNITFQPLIPTSTGVYCHLLSINNTKILINCGGYSSLYTQDLLKIINQCDCILITSFGAECIQGLWEILEKGFFKPVYMSVPIKEYSFIFQQVEFKNIYDIKYLQPFTVNDVQICAFASGNSLGASLFKITSNLENIYVGYNINHRKENHLNGIDLKKITDSYTFITNSSYCYKENINASVRNEQLLSLIKNWFTSKSQKMVIYVSYPRFHEIGLVLNNIKGKKICVLNRFIDKFINKSMNMIEWSNTKLIEQSDVYEYPNIDRVEFYSKLPTFDICVLLDEDISVLDDYNNENLCVVFIDKKFDVTQKPVFEYTGVYETKSEVKEDNILEESSDEEVDHHWSELKYEIKIDNNGKVIEEKAESSKNIFEEEYANIYGHLKREAPKMKNFYKLNDKLKFNKNKKVRNYDDYGEYINKEKFVIKIEKKELINEPVKIEKVHTEIKKIKKIGIIPKYKSVTFNLQGCSDLKHIKVILQNTESKKIIIVEDDIYSSKFMYTNLLCAVNDVQICNSLINLSSSTNINIVNVSDVMNNMENEGVKVQDNKMFRFIGIKEGDAIKFIKKAEEIAVCDFNDLKRKLQGVNMKVEKIEDYYIIQDKVIVRLENDKVILDGEEGDVYYHIRDILYENVILL